MLLWLDEAETYRKAAEQAGLAGRCELVAVPRGAVPDTALLDRADAILAWGAPAGLLARRDEGAQPLAAFLAGLDTPGAPPRVPGTAVYLTGQREVVPTALALNLRHNGVLHEAVALLHVRAERVPRVAEAERVTVAELGDGVRDVTVRFGFAEAPDVPAALRLHRREAGPDPDAASFFLGREVPVPSMRPELKAWEEPLFVFLTRNAVRAPDYFRILPPRVVELGTRVEL